MKLAQRLCEERHISLQDMAFIGDDVNDLSLLRAVGFSATPADALDYIQQEVHYVTKKQGGQGAFRELVEKILSDSGLLQSTIESLLL
ncbi:3-deoxy-D-manno-octulosonate 8-phosphate phosphatase KdsC [bioreactor metagenome]|uniref:3-deoxy-D-manno-octulosonate 8-phosphate phosphatase KdsC n=1 Tax=bioreactor metagenome TaxID=1076179 RepID=A0A645IJS1_9ZZZZ